jgi:hypothetical protein
MTVPELLLPISNSMSVKGLKILLFSSFLPLSIFIDFVV